VSLLSDFQAEHEALTSRVERLESLLEEKTALLHEVNHRAKNSLQMAMAMLSMQALASENDEVAEALRNASTKLGYFARVHELLYERGEDNQRVDVAEFLHNICDGLNKAYQRDGVQIDLRAEPLMLSAAQALNVGLFAGECILNAYKYAFPGAVGGVISVACQRFEGVVELAISDDGAGFPAEQRRGSLGMRLLRALGRALGGETHVESGTGTRVSVTFAFDDKRGREA